MKLLEVCKSGFLYKIETKPPNVSKYTSRDFDKEVIVEISSLVLCPGVSIGEMNMVLKIEIPFLEAYKISDQIVRYAHTVPTLDFVQFNNITESDLLAICATQLKTYQSIPFDIEEICYYPRNFCFEAYIAIHPLVYSNRYIIRDRWNPLFQQMFKTNKFNIVILPRDDKDDKT